MSSDFIQKIEILFKSEAMNEEANHSENIKTVVSNGITSTFGELELAYNDSFNLPNTLKLILSIILLKVSSLAPLEGRQGIEYFELFEYFIKIYPECISDAWTIYTSALILELSCGDHEIFMNWLEKLKNYYNIPDLAPVKTCIKNKLSQVYYSCIGKYLENFTKENTELFLQIALNLYEVDNSSEIMINQCINDILNKLNNEYDINDEKNNIKLPYNKNIDEAKTLLLCFQPKFRTFMNLENLEIYKSLKTKLKSKFNKYTLSSKLDKSLIQVGKKIYHKAVLNSYEIEIFYANYNNSQLHLIKKVYVFCQSTPGQILNEISKEIEILSFLSKNKLSCDLFIEFYEATWEENICTIYMEYGGTNLMEYISLLRSENRTLDPETIERWISELITGFNWLSQNGIVHRDIKPHNMVVREENGFLKLKIIDFGASDYNEGPEESFSEIGVNLIQGTRGYLAPELFEALNGRNERKTTFKPQKADVFSLGLTILQFITLRDFIGYNNPQLNDELLLIVDKINCKRNLRKMIEGMLDKDPSKRLSFRRCLCYLDVRNTLNI